MHHFTTKPQESKKHHAFIVGIDAKYFDNQLLTTAEGKSVSAFADPINPFPYELFLDTVQSYIVIREREYLDESTTTDPARLDANGEKKKGDPSVKQLLPYLIVRQLQADGAYLYFPYRRTKQVGESRLAGNGSVGYGGHVDLADVVQTKSAINLHETIVFSLVRESNEEFTIWRADGEGKGIGYVEPKDFSFPGLFIVDNSNAVGELHLGLIVTLDIPMGWNIKTVEDELATLPPMTLEQMLTGPEFKPENWTRIYLEYIRDREAEILASMQLVERGVTPDIGDHQRVEDHDDEFPIETDESGLERELTDCESEDDIPGSEGDEDEPN